MRPDLAAISLVDVPVLLPAEVPLDVAGEGIRNRLFLFADHAGREWCLRPDLTLPLTLAYIAQCREGGARAQAWTARGPVFRQPAGQGETAEFTQVGAEWFGFGEDAEESAVANVVDRLVEAGLDRMTVTFADAGLVGDVLDFLEVRGPWRERVRRALARPEALADLWKPGAGVAADTDAEPADPARRLAAALAHLPAEDAGAVLADVLELAGVEAVGGRTPAAIVSRLLRTAQSGGLAQLPEVARDTLARLATARGDLRAGAAGAAEVAEDLGLSARAAALRARAERFAAIAARHSIDGIAVNMRFEIGFSPRFSYYDGFLFDVASPVLGAERPLAAGGRYDSLIGHLSHGEVTGTATGASVRLDRLDAALRPWASAQS
jgi:ATP phosphoribosyltransferase regulatory subunit